MQFDIFHSIGRIDSLQPKLTDQQVFSQFLSQVVEAENLGFETVWMAESHFSSEVQKKHRNPVIPNYTGEVGLMTDSMQLIALLSEQTKRIGFGTAIHNIVGGNGGPIASADRVRMLAFLNGMRAEPRKLHIGFAAGRFPYINSPFGIFPRNTEEDILWPAYKRLVFLEATEVFLRLSQGHTISSEDTSHHEIRSNLFRCEKDWLHCLKLLKLPSTTTGIKYKKRWTFEPLKLVPELDAKSSERLHFVLGSHDPLAQNLATKWADIGVFNLSFTPIDQVNKVHETMKSIYRSKSQAWSRSQMPRTAIVFIDSELKKAQARASSSFDTYINAMSGTAALPKKEELMARALIGTPEMICEQLMPTAPLGYQSEDRLMLWFEFNQVSHDDIIHQMQLFAEHVMPNFNDPSRTAT